jgi:hypothetical protein
VETECRKFGDELPKRRHRSIEMTACFVTSGSKATNAKSAARSAFWSSYQRLFNHIITGVRRQSTRTHPAAELND